MATMRDDDDILAHYRVRYPHSSLIRANSRRTTTLMTVRIKWTIQHVYDDGKDQTGESQDGLHYVIARTPQGQYEALLGLKDGERIKLGTFGDAYWACVDHNWSEQTPEVQATRHGTVMRPPQPKPAPLCPECFTQHAGECI